VTATDQLALEGRGERPLTAVARTPSSPPEALLDELAERMAAAPRGLIVAGRQTDPALAEPLGELAAATGYPLLAEPTSQLRRGPHDRSRLICAYDLIARTPSEQLAPELILRVGDMPTSKPLRLWLASLDGLRQVVLDGDSNWREPTRKADTIVRADPAGAAAGLASRLKAAAASPERAEASWADDWRQADDRVRAVVERRLGSLDELSEPGAWASFGRALRDGDSVFAASSMPVRDMEMLMSSGPERVRFFSNRGANGIDGLTSTASGIAASGGGRTWAVLGDLAVLHDLGGLAAAKEQENLRLLVLDNGGGGIFHFLPQAEAMPEDEFEALLGTPSKVDPAAALELFGLDPVLPGAPAELDEALAGDARAVVVRVDRRRNRELHGQIAEAAAAALPSA
jgi:2-succinyl-5-enolpyruvyl-6-hydroxy-3-cyclohexene-1-carboxylate synthase